MKTANLFNNIPADLQQEAFDLIVENGDLRIERIVSKGHASPVSGWYDQPKNEWVIVLKGAACIVFETAEKVRLEPGDHITIPAHKKHKVEWTLPETETIWLAIHY